jgi:NADPH:quinone reductase-like Zn-dependent oxidoreductase
MTAIMLIRYGDAEQAFAVRELPAPEPPPGHVQIQVQAFGLNFADVLARRGLYADAPKPPFVPGYEVVGRIRRLGPGVTDHRVGERVVGFTRFGGYAEYVITPAAVVAGIGDSLDHCAAAALGTQYCTAYYAACEITNLFAKERVLIHAAAGGVGTALVQLARRRGCEIFGTAGSEAKLAYLRKLGVDHAINYRTASFDQEVKRLLQGARLDVVFDSLGGRTYRQSRALLGTGGRIVSFGVAEMSGRRGGWLGALKLAWDFGWLHPLALLMKSRAVLGVNMLRIADDKPHVLRRCLRAVVKLATEGELVPPPGTVFKSTQIADAHRHLEERTSMGKIVVEW